ncbi:MAG: DNA repair protein RadA, partial [Proteobacteria bacterium]|nr:DNA repair protein RadA [Pseudomonadota bacterium]
MNPDEAPRRTGGISEFDRVLGGGIVPGALMLIGGDPGIGKSTLLLQVAARVASGGSRVLYVSGEESARQVRLRASRLGALEPSLFVLAETNVEAASAAIARLDPAMVVVDSIQTMWSDALASSPGNVAQLRESTLRLMQVAKARDVPIFLIGHVTKEGNVAGPRALEHMVDAVLYLEGERYYSYRLLRAAKNRFGSTNEVGVFEMTTDGLAEVTNPSAAFLAGRVARQPGSIVTAPVEGTRALLVDVQALTVPGGIGIARRTAIGADLNRLQLLVAVLTRRLGLGLGAQDIYVNVAGGL